MKRSPEDFKDKLAGRQDKIAAVNEIKHDLAGAGLTCKTSRRKLASGVKIYFIVSPPDSISGTKAWWDKVHSVRSYTLDVVGKHFPECSLTSGGPSGWTIAEF